MSSLICNFLVTVGANVVSYYICKWLDSYRKDPPRTHTPRGFAFGAQMNSPASFLWLLSLYAKQQKCQAIWKKVYFYGHDSPTKTASPGSLPRVAVPSVYFGP